jgi:hypothetical protein
MLASAWTTTRVTGGEHLFAPAAMTDPAAPRSQRPGGRERLLFIDLSWPQRRDSHEHFGQSRHDQDSRHSPPLARYRAHTAKWRAPSQARVTEHASEAADQGEVRA